MTLKEALAQRIPRIREPHWRSSKCYLRLPLFADGTHGPWAELYDEDIQVNILDERPGKHKMCVLLNDYGQLDTEFMAYDGEVSKYEQDPDNFSKSYVEK